MKFIFLFISLVFISTVFAADANKMPVKVKRLAHRAIEISHVSKTGSKIMGPVYIVNITSNDSNKLLIKITPNNIKKSVDEVLYSIHAPTFPFSATAPKSEALLSTSGLSKIAALDLTSLKEGTYKAFLKINLEKKKSHHLAFAVIEFTRKVVEYIDGDLVPPNPGPNGETTLMGVDSDNDGVRDDVELWINALDLSSDKREVLIKYAKGMQKQLSISSSREKSNLATRLLINITNCAVYRFDRKEAFRTLKRLSVIQYNTKERLTEWARIEGHFGGSRVESPVDKSSSCNF